MPGCQFTFVPIQIKKTIALISIVVLLLLSVVFWSSFLSAAEINLSRSKVIQLALHLEVAEPELRYDFIQIALSEMYYSYQNEWQKSLENLPHDRKKRAKIAGWRYATQSYLQSLEHLLLLIDSELPLEFFISAQNKLVILVAQQPVIITGPNAGANKQIERNIVDKFCQLHDCREYFTEIASQKERLKDAQRIPSGEVISGSWSIKANMQAEFATSNHMVFIFATIKNRQEKEQWAIAVAEEVVRLIDAVAIARKKGNRIDWSVLKIEDLPLTDKAHRLNVNSRGDFIKISLPRLGAHKTLFAQLAPWIAIHFDKHEISRIIINKAERYFKP